MSRENVLRESEKDNSHSCETTNFTGSDLLKIIPECEKNRNYMVIYFVWSLNKISLENLLLRHTYKASLTESRLFWNRHVDGDILGIASIPELFPTDTTILIHIHP